MKYQFSLLLILPLFIFSCNDKDDSMIDPSASVNGEWKVTTVKTTLQNQGTTASTTNLDLSADGIFFNFNTDGTYTTNAKINLNSVTKSENVISGTYTLSSTSLKLDYFFEDFNINVNFDFTITELSNNSMVFALDEKALTDAFNNSLSNLSATNQIIAKALISSIVDFEILFNLQK